MHLISPHDLKRQFSLSPRTSNFIEKSRQTIIDIFEEKDSRLLLIVGPCSIHNVEEGLEYAKKFKQLAEEVKDTFFLVMRAYIEKPRTRKEWKGLLYDPHLDGSHDIAKGLELSRDFLVTLAEMNIPAAMEFLTPHLTPYIEDLITWGCIGARTSSSQIHRVLASHLLMPVGFKNTIDGNTESAVSAVHVAQSPHAFMNICESGKVKEIRSLGNPHTHVVLRGGGHQTNYDPESIEKVTAELELFGLPKRVMIDCSHGNSQGNYLKQKEIFLSVTEEIRTRNSPVFGIMMESNLEAGKQKIPSQLEMLVSGVSITDGCLSFSETAELISSVSSSMMISLTKS